MKLKRNLLIILAVQIGSYLFLGNFMLKEQIFDEFEEFNKRRLANKYNVKHDTIWNQFHFSSCGDEFFRSIKKINKTIIKSNPEAYKIGQPFSIIDYGSYYSPLEFYYETDNQNNKLNLIRFSACKTNNIPFLITEIELIESFSNHKNFHAMHYNNQLLKYDVYYIWVLFKWVRVYKEVNLF